MAHDAHTANSNDSFQLYDLRVEVICPPGERILCGAKEGDYLTLEGEMLHLPAGQGFSIYSIGKHHHHCYAVIRESHRLNPFGFNTGAILPLLAAKQRSTHPNDWMSTDAEIACPDPHCKSRLKIVRTGIRTFNHGDVTAVPLHDAAVGED